VVIAREGGFDQTLGFDLERSDLLDRTAYISENKSRHSGFLRAISTSFFARPHLLSCFSLAIALVGSEYASK